MVFSGGMRASGMSDRAKQLVQAVVVDKAFVRPTPPTRLGDVPTPHRLRPIPPRPKEFLEFRQEHLHSLLLDHRQALPVDAASASFASHPLPRL